MIRISGRKAYLGDTELNLDFFNPRARMKGFDTDKYMSTETYRAVEPLKQQKMEIIEPVKKDVIEGWKMNKIIADFEKPEVNLPQKILKSELEAGGIDVYGVGGRFKIQTGTKLKTVEPVIEQYPIYDKAIYDKPLSAPYVTTLPSAAEW